MHEWRVQHRQVAVGGIVKHSWHVASPTVVHLAAWKNDNQVKAAMLILWLQW